MHATSGRTGRAPALLAAGATVLALGFAGSLLAATPAAAAGDPTLGRYLIPDPEPGWTAAPATVDEQYAQEIADLQQSADDTGFGPAPQVQVAADVWYSAGARQALAIVLMTSPNTSVSPSFVDGAVSTICPGAASPFPSDPSIHDSAEATCNNTHLGDVTTITWIHGNIAALVAGFGGLDPSVVEAAASAQNRALPSGLNAIVRDVLIGGGALILLLILLTLLGNGGSHRRRSRTGKGRPSTGFVSRLAVAQPSSTSTGAYPAGGGVAAAAYAPPGTVGGNGAGPYRVGMAGPATYKPGVTELPPYRPTRVPAPPPRPGMAYPTASPYPPASAYPPAGAYPSADAYPPASAYPPPGAYPAAGAYPASAGQAAGSYAPAGQYPAEQPYPPAGPGQAASADAQPRPYPAANGYPQPGGGQALGAYAPPLGSAVPYTNGNGGSAPRTDSGYLGDGLGGGARYDPAWDLRAVSAGDAVHAGATVASGASAESAAAGHGYSPVGAETGWDAPPAEEWTDPSAPAVGWYPIAGNRFQQAYFDGQGWVARKRWDGERWVDLT